jgi:hypothetical protein
MTIENTQSYEDKIDDLNDDLLTVLDGHMDDLEMDDLFYRSLRFITFSLCKCVENDNKSFRILKKAMDEGIMDYMQNKEF